MTNYELRRVNLYRATPGLPSTLREYTDSIGEQGKQRRKSQVIKVMIELPIYDKKGKQVDTLNIDEASLGAEVRPTLLKQAYVMFHSNRRQGSARPKSRGMVEGSTRKIY